MRTVNGKIFLIPLLITVATVVASLSFTQPQTPADLTKEELVTRLVDILDYNEEVLDFIPGLKREKDEQGNIFYTYTPQGGIAKKLEELDKNTLINIFEGVSSQMNRLNTERLIRQLEQIKEVQQIPKAPPQPPKVYTPPQTPTQPSTPPSPPPRAPRR